MLLIILHCSVSAAIVACLILVNFRRKYSSQECFKPFIAYSTLHGLHKYKVEKLNSLEPMRNYRFCSTVFPRYFIVKFRSFSAL